MAWVFSRLAGRAMGTEPPAIFTTLGRTRGLFWGWLHFASRLMPGGKLSRRESELVILRVAHRRANAYEWAHHQRLGRRAGLSSADIERVRGEASDPGWQARDQALLRAVDELLDTRDLSDESFTALRSEFDDRRLIEFLLLVGHYDMLATTLSTLRIEPDQQRKR
jgi:alkylhydroperoxidase family enzyme